MFTGKELDPETGLYYFGARYYDPVLSRWISADPILEKYLPTGNKQKDQKLPGVGGVFNRVNLALYGYAHLNPLIYIDPNGEEDIIAVRNSKAKNKQLESIAMIYSDKTIGGFKLFALKAWGGLKGLFGSSLNEKDVKFFFGDPKKSFDKFSTLSDDPSKYGTAAAGKMYTYEQKEMKRMKVSFAISSDLGEGIVPQDPAYNHGIDPATNKTYLTDVFMHPAHGGTIDDSYTKGSTGCSTRYGFTEMYNYLMKSDTGSEGRYIIFR